MSATLFTATLQNNRIVIRFPYLPNLVEAVRSIPDRAWNPTHKQWEVPNTPWHCAKVIEVLKPHSGFEIAPEIKKCADATADKPNLRKKLPKNLYPYQKEGIEHIYAARGRALVADDMGLGKSAEALVWSYLFGGRKILIVSPANVTWKWALKEAAMWAQGHTVQVVEGGKTKMFDTNITIMSYRTMVIRYEELSTIPFDTIIFDEAHYLKSNKSQQNRMARKLVKGVPYLLMLTGTPFKNRRFELFQLLHMLDPKVWSNAIEFGTRYCGGKFMNGHWITPPDGETNTEELQDRLAPLMLRRTKKQVAIDLPDLTRVTIPMYIDNDREYETVLKGLRRQAHEEGYQPGASLVLLNKLRQIVGRGKISAAVELTQDVLETGNQVVLFAHHKEVVKGLIDGLMKSGVKADAIGVISGSTTPTERYNLQEVFLSDKSWLQVMIVSSAGREGLDLYSSSHVIFVERLWTPADEEQVEARLHRNGQKSAVTSHYLVARGTVDEHLDNVVSRKRKEFGNLIETDIIREVWKEVFA